MKKSVSCTQRSTCSQILYYALEKWTRTHSQTLHGKKDWRGSKVHQNTELWTKLMVSQWNSSGISSQDSPHCSTVTKSKSYCQDWAYNQKTSLDGLSSCRCSTTSHGDLKTNKKECESSAQLVSLYAKRFGAGQWSFLGPRSEKKWYSSEDSPQGEWDRIADQYSDPRVHYPEECLRAKVVENCQCTCADSGTIKTVFLHNYFCKSAQSLRSSQQKCVKNVTPAMIEQGDPLSWCNQVPHSCQAWWRQTYLWLTILHKKKIYCEDIENELKSYHNKTEWANVVLMQESWPQLKSDSISWRETLKNPHNSQILWPVVSTLCQEMKVYLNQKVGNCQGETTNSEKNFKGNGRVSTRQNQQMTLKPARDFWSIQGDFICRHHNEPRVQLYVPKEETFPVLLKYIDVTGSTHTDLDVLQEKKDWR